MADVHAAGPRGRLLSVGTKLSFVVAVFVVLLGVLAATQLSERERRNSIAAKQAGAARVVRLFSLSVYPALDFDDQLAVEESLERLTHDPEVIAASVWRNEVDEAMASFARSEREPAPLRAPASTELSFSVEQHRLVVHSPIHDDMGTLLGSTTIVWSLAREEQGYARARALIVRTTSVSVAVLILVLMLVTHLIVSRPLAQLEHAARTLGRGDQIALNVHGRDEVGSLARVFGDMAAAITDREQRLHHANQELETLFDTLRQGVLAIDRDGRVVGRASRAAQRLFGPEPLQQRQLTELLLSGHADDDPDRLALELWLEEALTATPQEWDELEALAPGEMSLEVGGAELELRLEFQPLFEAGVLERLLVLVSDETDRRRLEREASARESAHEQEMRTMRGIVASGTLPFATFLREAGTRLARIAELEQSSAPAFPVAQCDEMFRHAHTVKGEARTFGLVALERSAALLEDSLERGRHADAGREVLGEELRAHISDARASLEASRRRLVEASPLGEEVLEQLTVMAPDLHAVRELTRGAQPQLRAAVERLASRPFAECVAGLVDAAPTWAAARGKLVEVELEGASVRISASLAEVLRGATTHLIRNAIAHGVEARGTRERLGKPAKGRIELRASRCAGGVEVVVADDGQGLGAARDWIFTAGATTLDEVDELAGRGMGLAAVRSELAEVGYEIEVAASSERGTTMRIRPRSHT